MLIQKSRIRNVELHLGFLQPGQRFILGVSGPASEQLLKAGFPLDARQGDSVLPAVVGPASRFNARGKEIVRRDLAKEQRFSVFEWSWTEWHGKEPIEKTDFREREYQRYPRDFVSPPSVELHLTRGSDGNLVVHAEGMTWGHTGHDLVRNAVNLLLELFGGCEILSDDLLPLLAPPTRRLNWHLLPPGHMPWDQLRPKLETLAQNTGPRRRSWILSRFATVNGLGPDFTAIGRGGFEGYVVFGFTPRLLYILESALSDNATYIFREDWEELSQWTKAQVLAADRHHARLVHRASWAGELGRVLEGG